ncbi:fungal-specific transcription factor domain-containing protein [Diaporthe sp. PMI_573]|nr:fungal-specific transcription factor domain-containing protein [Diaporthaceae sp. PMI_573]
MNTIAGIHKLDITLPGEENQAVRRLIRVSQMRFTAINDSGIPFLAELLPLATRFGTVKKALLALARVLHTPSPRCAEPSSAASALESYQVALTTLREKIATIDVSKASDSDVLEVLGAALLLTLAGFPRSDQHSTAWSHHIVGLVTLIESLSPDVIGATVLGEYARESVAYLDIAAFSLGRPLKARNAWLRWDVHPPETPPTDDFSSLEVVVGYPKSLLTIIATISAIFDGPDQDLLPTLSELVERLHSHSIGGDAASPWTTALTGADDNLPSNVLSNLDTVLTRWSPPTIPSRLSASISVALVGAWEIMRKAALLYLWRGGFTANIFDPLPAQRAALVPRFVHEMLFGFRALVACLETDCITIMNVMTWPLAVIGNECGGDCRTQGEVDHFISVIQTRFQIQHLSHVSQILQELWRRYEHQPLPSTAPGHNRHLCIDDVSKDLGVCIPLF